MNRRWLLQLCAVAALCVPLGLVGCAGDTGDDDGPVGPPSDGAVSGTSTTPSSDLQEIAERVAAVLALGYNTTNPDVVAKALMDGDPDNDPFVVDTREATDYAKGHIPGATNIPLQTLPMALADGTSGIPMDQEVIVASYWGNDGNMASLLINAYRVADPSNKAAYPKSTALFQGMTSWSFDRELVPANTRFEDAQAAGIVVERATETTANVGTDQGAYPTFNAFPSDDVVEKILLRAHEYLNSVPSQFDLQVYPSAVAAMIDAGDAPPIVSVRAGSAYASGHIPGAINIAYQQVADLANNTKLLDPSETVYVYCYTGHTGSLSTMALGILGYPARDILYGINGWTQDSAVASGQLANFDLMRGWDFPVDDGGAGDLGSLAAFVPVSGCQGCHTDLSSIFYDREIANPPAATVAPPSEGEG